MMDFINRQNKLRRPASLARAGAADRCRSSLQSARQRLGAHRRHRAALRAAGAGPEHRGRLRRPARPGLRRLLCGRRLHVRPAGVAAPDRRPSRAIARACSRSGLHMPLWVVIPLGAALAGMFGVAAGRADAEAARRLPGHRDARLRRDHPRVPEQPGRSRSTSPTARRASTRSTRSHFFGARPRARPHELSAASTIAVGARCTTTCSWRWCIGQRRHLPPAASVRASAAPGWRSARTRSRPRRWASTPAT